MLLFSYTNVVERGGLFLLTENILVRTFDSQCSKSGDFLLGAEAVTGVVCATSAATSHQPLIGTSITLPSPSSIWASFGSLAKPRSLDQTLCCAEGRTRVGVVRFILCYVKFINITGIDRLLVLYLQTYRHKHLGRYHSIRGDGLGGK